MTQIFYPSANTIARTTVIVTPLLVVGALVVLWAWLRSPGTTGVDMVVDQPVPFSHEHHVSGLGLDCRYCHQTVETSAYAGMPATQVCMNCHAQIWTNADMLEPVREGFRNNRPLRWNRVHDLPDYVYFNHSIHVNKGVGCVECHGRVDRMPLMRKTETLRMQWCLDCHRHPQTRLRPADAVFDLDWECDDNDPSGEALMNDMNIDGKHLTDCTICHR